MNSLFVALALLLSAQDFPVERLEALPGFKIEHVLKADPKVHGSWINLARDPKGRLLLAGQRGQPLTRITLKDGRVVQQEDLKLPVSEIMGLLCAYDSLYVNGMGKDPAGRGVYGLFRCKDTKGADQYDQVEFLREWKGGSGEHGAHGIVLGNDGKLYIVAGNFTDISADLRPSSPHRTYADDLILPRAEDGNGFGAGRKPPGGWIIRVDPDGKNPELFAAGQRNTYDIAFNANGDLFGYDSDMEWDWGTPWYRPTRVFHAAGGADHGFREGSAKWPNHYADSLPTTVDIGVGCPTGVLFGTGARFPAKYQKAFYILDWTYGRLIAVHLTPQGASYAATWENLVAPAGLKGKGPKSPLNLTDLIVGEDGALYFTVGGRGTQAQLFRVRYVGTESTEPAVLADTEGAEARLRRRALEAFHGKVDPAGLDLAWKNLGDSDRYIQYAARIALERQPVESWKTRALEETNPRAALVALLALARVGGPEAQPALYKALARIPTNTQTVDKLRVIQVSVARHGKPADATTLVAELDPLYPSKDLLLNAELCQVLLALDAPQAVAKTVGLLAAAPTFEEQIGYALHLRSVTKGWTPELRKTYFSWFTKDRNKAEHSAEVRKWFEDAGRGYSDGASLPKFIGNLHTQSKAGLSPEETQALADVLAAYVPPGLKPKTPAKVRAFVKEWKMDDLLPALEGVAKDRNFERGREIYASAQCAQCHKFGTDGGSVGAELTAVSSRYSRRDILEALIEPSKVISEQYQNTMILTLGGKILDGRVLEENAERLVLQPNPLLPEKIEVKKKDIDKRAASKVSPMPANLINNLSKEEILDLLAYMESGGKKDFPAFASLKKAVDVTDQIAAGLKNNRVSITASNDTFGEDPAPGEVKRLKVEYLEGGEARVKVVKENETLELKAPEGKKLIIQKAVYGVFP